jgi:hypothetical protein
LEGGIESLLSLGCESLLPMSPALKTRAARAAGTTFPFCLLSRIDAVTFPHHRDDLPQFTRSLGTLRLPSRLRSRSFGERPPCRTWYPTLRFSHRQDLHRV